MIYLYGKNNNYLKDKIILIKSLCLLQKYQKNKIKRDASMFLDLNV